MYSVPDILLECVQSQATENRDKVWALVGIGADLRIPDPAPGLSPTSLEDMQLFTAVTSHVLQHTTGGSRYALFGSAGRKNVSHRSETDNRWASWVPDLATPPKVYPLGNATCPYAVGRGLTVEVDVNPENPLVLRIKGTLLDELALVNRQNP
jgi:hypothetical protein